MKRLAPLKLPLAAILLSVCAFTTSGARASTPSPVEGFVAVNGVQLQYLDWGGSGPALILIHGLADNPHVFDDLAPAFTDRFHVVAYARRGSGDSDRRGPYDVETLTEDLRSLIDALGLSKANLVGLSAGGEEMTRLAAEYPDRVDRIVYLDGGYDFSDPDFHAAVKALPLGFFDPPSSAMASLSAYRSYLKSTVYPGLDDIGRLDGNLREKVVVQSDGSLKERTPRATVNALYSALWVNRPREYAQIHCPALAIYAEHLYDLGFADTQRRRAVTEYEQKYWGPFQAKSINVIHRSLPNVEIVHVPGAHSSFFLTDREEVVSTVRRFLEGSSQAVAKVDR